MEDVRWSRRRLIAGLSLAAVVPAARAQAWPQRPLRVIVAGPPGSGPDAMMRAIADKLAQELGQPVVVDNKPGAGGVIAVQALQQAHDGHTVIFMMTSVGVLAPLLFKSARFDPARDFVSITGLAETSLMMVASSAAPAKSLPALLKLAGEKPDEIVVGHAGTGTLTHLAAESLAQQAHVRFRIVGFNGAATALPALVNGDAQYYIDALATVQPMLKTGRVLPIAVFSPKPLPGWEAYPLANDTVRGAEFVGRFGLMANRDIPPEGVAALAAAAKKALADPAIATRLRDFGTYPGYLDGGAYLAGLRREQAQWGQVVKAAGIEAQ